jgi:hypothetical protein
MEKQYILALTLAQFGVSQAPPNRRSNPFAYW